MLDVRNEQLLKDIAQNRDTPVLTRVNAASLCNKLGALPAKEVIGILQEIVDDPRTKCGVQVKALELIDKINDATGQEPELDSEGVANASKNLWDEFVVCPNQT